jgi:adenylate cyclase
MNESSSLISESQIEELLKECTAILSSNPGLAKEAAEKAFQHSKQIDSIQKMGEASLLVGKAQYLLNQKAEALQNFTIALNSAQKALDDKTEAVAWNNIGLIHFENTRWQEAKDAYTQSLLIKERSSDIKGTAITCTNLGVVYFHLAGYPEALHYCNRAQRIFENLNEFQLLAKAMINAGQIYMIDENYEEALNCYFVAIKIINGTSDAIQLIQIHNSMGNAFLAMKRYDEAMQYLKESLKMSREVDYSFGVTTALGNLSRLMLDQGDYESCGSYCYEIIGSANPTEKGALTQAHLNLGRIYFEEGKLEEAREELNEALQLAKSFESKRLLSEVFQHLIKVSESQGDYQKAFEYQREYQALKDELYNARLDRKLAEVKFQNELEQQQKEAEIERLRNVELRQEKEKSDSLLKNILPDEIAEELKVKGYSEARYYENVTVLFTDFQSFTKVALRLSPQKLVDELHTCFKAFDEIISKYNIEKIKTIGDAYMAAAGIPGANANHAGDMVKAAIEIRDFMESRRKPGEINQDDCANFEIRIGINSGPVVAGIVGVKKFAYDIWGDTVNTAARMEQGSKPGYINISGSTYQLIKDKFNCTYRGKIEAKNKGQVDMYFVEHSLT